VNLYSQGPARGVALGGDGARYGSEVWWRRKQARRSLAEEGVKKQYGSDLIDDRGTLLAARFALARDTGAVKKTVGLRGGETLVKQMDADAGMPFPKSFGQTMALERLWTKRSGRVERQADDQVVDSILANNASDVLQVGTQVGAIKGEERLRCVAEWVGESETDATITDVEGKSPVCGLSEL